MNRLRDYPGVAELERRALFMPGIAAESAALHVPEIGELQESLFGVRQENIGLDYPADDASDEELALYENEFHNFWEKYSLAEMPEREQMVALEAMGWDVSDEYGRPLLILKHLIYPLLAAIRGEYGARLPDISQTAEVWGDALGDEIRRWQKRR